MNHRTKYPAGSPRDVRVRVRRIEREVEALLRQVQSLNDNNPNFAAEPLDVGRYLVQLRKVRGVLAEIDAAIESGAATLPDNVLAPLCDPW